MSPRTIPRDTTAEILLLLPVKSLVRFKLVSSSWWSLISDPFFRRTYFNRAIQNPELCSQKALLSTSSRFMFFDPEESFGVDGNSVVDLRFPAETRHPHLRIVGSCNGLVCLVSSRSRDFFLWNPSTGDCNELPDACSPLGNRYFNSGLGVLGGCLCLIYACFSDPYPFELWVMKEYGVEASWTKLCRLLNPDDHTFLYGGHHLSVSHKVFYEPLCMCTSKDNAFILIRSTKEVIRFNERGEVLEKVGICDDSDKCEGIAFVESIASVNHP
ncbi:hypothetical protein SLA2020_195150 [Shorea laevis]